MTDIDKDLLHSFLKIFVGWRRAALPLPASMEPVMPASMEPVMSVH